MRAIVVGCGSIGARHLNVLNDLGIETAVVSRRVVPYKPSYLTMEEGLECFKPDIIIISNETSQHHQTLEVLNEFKFKGNILIEKPLFANSQCEVNVDALNLSKVFIGYNLRFHPLLTKLREQLINEQITSSHLYVGQYLPTWRPSTDYRKSYSSNQSGGGGVLRDLSHELDYINWLFGKWSRLTAAGGKYSSLEINTDDTFTALIETKRCPIVTVEMNYVDRIIQRFIIVNTINHTFKVDFIKGTFQKNQITEHITVGRNDTYEKQHAAMLKGDYNSLCNFHQGLEVVKMIEAIEEANTTQRWVENG